MKQKLLILSFIEGSVVMSAELCGAKLLAPIFGSSLFVWASVMGITLAALAGGYFLGGEVSARSKNFGRDLFKILNAAAILVMLMPVISYYLVPRISYLEFLPAVVLGTITLLFFPVFFLGASSPLFIALQSQTSDAGKVSGTVYAVSTAGGIISTFLCGFYLIPGIGLTACLLGFGGVLFLSNLFIFKIFKTAQLFFIVACLYLNFQILPTKQQQLLVSESILGHLEILDLASNATDSVRVLRINNIVQTEMSLRTKKSVSAYIQLLDTLIPQRQKQGDALILGLGGGLNANLLCDKNYRTVGVEIDPRIIDAAKIYFGLNKNVKTVCADARYFLNAEKKKFDLVLIDIFKAEEQPSHILTTESLLQLKQNLNDSAMLYINWHGYVQGKMGQGTSILNNTLIQAGFKVQMCSTSNDENYRNVMFVASLSRLKPQPYLLNETFFATNLVNTDDLPLLEKYNADANKIWRVNYLRYYQQQ
jgi:predicted membrane-bound spermidine synthase